MREGGRQAGRQAGRQGGTKENRKSMVGLLWHTTSYIAFAVLSLWFRAFPGGPDQ